MSESTVPVFDLRVLAAASKRRSHQEHILRIARALTRCLVTNRLTPRQWSEADWGPTKSLQITEGDLTPEGLAVIRSGYYSWLRFTDREGDPADVSILERELRRVRGESGVA